MKFWILQKEIKTIKFKIKKNSSLVENHKIFKYGKKTWNKTASATIRYSELETSPNNLTSCGPELHKQITWEKTKFLLRPIPVTKAKPKNANRTSRKKNEHRNEPYITSAMNYMSSVTSRLYCYIFLYKSQQTLFQTLFPNDILQFFSLGLSEERHPYESANRSERMELPTALPRWVDKAQSGCGSFKSVKTLVRIEISIKIRQNFFISKSIKISCNLQSPELSQCNESRKIINLRPDEYETSDDFQRTKSACHHAQFVSRRKIRQSSERLFFMKSIFLMQKPSMQGYRYHSDQYNGVGKFSYWTWMCRSSGHL